MNTLGLAAPNRIRCQRTAVARPCRGSLRLRGLVVDNSVCETCGKTFAKGPSHRTARFCTLTCYRSRAPEATRIDAALALPHGLPIPRVDTPCMPGEAGYLDPRGYRVLTIGDRRVRAHRYAWEKVKGPIPAGLQIDHLCRNKACINVEHMEVTTGKVNSLRSKSPWAVNARRTHCHAGHEFTPENTYLQHGHNRGCRTCRRVRARADYRRLRDDRMRREVTDTLYEGGTE